MGMSEFRVRSWVGTDSETSLSLIQFGRVVWFLNNSARYQSQVIVNVLRFDQEKFDKTWYKFKCKFDCTSDKRVSSSASKVQSLLTLFTSECPLLSTSVVKSSRDDHISFLCRDSKSILSREIDNLITGQSRAVCRH